MIVNKCKKYNPLAESEHMDLWKKADNHRGVNWWGWYVFPIGRNRDSDILENSNFEAALEKLTALPEVLVEPPDRYLGRGVPKDEKVDSVICVNNNHWAVGWIEWIAIHPRNRAAVRLADELIDRYNSYPVLDECHYEDMLDQDRGEFIEKCLIPAIENELRLVVNKEDEYEECPDELWYQAEKCLSFMEKGGIPHVYNYECSMAERAEERASTEGFWMDEEAYAKEQIRWIVSQFTEDSKLEGGHGQMSLFD